MDMKSNELRKNGFKNLMIKVGLLKVNRGMGSGTILQELDEEDMKELNELEVLNNELLELQTQQIELNGKINAKYMHLESRRKLFWLTLKARYNHLRLYDKGMYLDIKAHCVREGVVSKEYINGKPY